MGDSRGGSGSSQEEHQSRERCTEAQAQAAKVPPALSRAGVRAPCEEGPEAQERSVTKNSRKQGLMLSMAGGAACFPLTRGDTGASPRKGHALVMGSN